MTTGDRNREDSAQPAAENDNTRAQKPRPFLKKGQGISRFGNIQYPKAFGSKSAGSIPSYQQQPSTMSADNRPSSASSEHQTTGEGDAAGRNTANSAGGSGKTPRPVTAGTDSGCEDPATFSPLPVVSSRADTSAGNTSRALQDASLSETQQFEALEHALSSENSSLDMSAMYKQIKDQAVARAQKLLQQRRQPDNQHQSLLSSTNASGSTGDDESSQFVSPAKPDESANTTGRSESQASTPTVHSLSSSESACISRLADRQQHNQQQQQQQQNILLNPYASLPRYPSLPRVSAKKDSFSQSQPKSLLTGHFPINSLARNPLAQVQPQVQQQQQPDQQQQQQAPSAQQQQSNWTSSVSPIEPLPPPPTSTSAPTTTTTNLATAGRSPLEVQLILHLQKVIQQLQTDYAAFQQRERRLLEELQHERGELDRKLMAERSELRDERQQFDSYRDNELAAIKKARDGLNRQRSLVNKKEDEQTKILREQLNDVQAKLSDRDAQLSAQRAKLRGQDDRLRELGQKLKDKTGELERTNKRFAAAEEANAALRVKLAKQAYSSSTQPVTSSTPPVSRAATQQQRSRATPPTTSSAPTSTAASGGGRLSTAAQQQQQTNSKRVHFNLPAGQPADSTSNNTSSTLQSFSSLKFIRTDDANTQTSFMRPNQIVDPDDEDGGNATVDALLLSPNRTIQAPVTVTYTRKLPDNSCEMIYSNGTREFASSSGMHRYDYSNGDCRQVHPDGTQHYYYAAKRIQQTIEPNGNQIIQFDDGRTEKHLVDGTKQITRNGKTTLIDVNGMARTEHTEGGRLISTELAHPDGTVELRFPNGDVETKAPNTNYVKRAFADGNVKYQYGSGATISEYTDATVRIKDAGGKVLWSQKGRPPADVMQRLFTDMHLGRA